MQFVLDGTYPDIGFLTRDALLFYSHSAHLRAISRNAFDGLLDAEGIQATGDIKIVAVTEDAELFNVVLLTVYGLPCDQFQPSLDTLLGAVQVLKTYGMSLDRFVGLSTPLFDLISIESPRRPLEVFLTATENGLEALAVATSSRLLSFPITDITDEIVDRMGPRYLRRFVMLQWSRILFLNKLLLDAPKLHPDLDNCGFVQQRRLRDAWSLAAASLLCAMQPGEYHLYRNTNQEF